MGTSDSEAGHVLGPPAGFARGCLGRDGRWWPILILQPLAALVEPRMAAPLSSMPNTPWATPPCLALGWVFRQREEAA